MARSEVGKFLLGKLDEQGRTQGDLAETLGVSASYVSAIVRGKKRACSAKLPVLIAAYVVHWWQCRMLGRQV